MGSGVTHRREPEARVWALINVGAGVNGLESVSVYLYNLLNLKIKRLNQNY